MQKRVLSILTSQTSNNNQVISLSKNIDSQFEKIKIEQTFFAKIDKIINLPIQFVYKNFGKIKKQLSESCSKIDICISCGQSSLKLVKYIKKKYKNIKTVHILKPNLISNYIDCVLIPNHDDLGFLKKRAHTKIIRYNGSFYDYDLLFKNYSENEIEIEKRIENIFKAEKYISIVLGGDTRYFKYNYETAENFTKVINNLIETNDWIKSAILITTSRRTPDFFYQYLKDNIKIQKVFFYNQKNSKNINPYRVFLKKSSFSFVTKDSISMISESLVKFDKVIIYEGNIKHPKYDKFIEGIKKNTLIEKKVDYTLINKEEEINNFDRILELINKVLYGW